MAFGVAARCLLKKGNVDLHVRTVSASANASKGKLLISLAGNIRLESVAANQQALIFGEAMANAHFALSRIMAFGIFIHRPDSIYNDRPAEYYQFPKSYLSRAEKCVGGWIIYYEPVKMRNTRGYYAFAKVREIVPDSTVAGRFLANIENGSYLEFPNHVPYNGPAGVIERGVLNDEGKNSGRAQAAVRPLSGADFNRILDLGFAGDDALLPRDDEPTSDNVLQDQRTPFVFEQLRDRVTFLSTRIERDRAFRRVVLRAYDKRCTITGLKLINGGGRAEVQAAHIQPVEENGPDSINNGLALSGTVHWMFDRGLLTLEDDMLIRISRQVNDPDGVRSMINKSGYAFMPPHLADRPHPHFLSWHREYRFKR